MLAKTFLACSNHSKIKGIEQEQTLKEDVGEGLLLIGKQRNNARVLACASTRGSGRGGAEARG